MTSVLQTIGVVLGVWTLVGAATALLLIPRFRVRAVRNERLSLLYPNADWLATAGPIDGRKSAAR